jgi:hypothetical protein
MIAQMMAVHMLIHPTKEIMAPLDEAFGNFIKLSGRRKRLFCLSGPTAPRLAITVREESW